jgi:hypothetical protein
MIKLAELKRLQGRWGVDQESKNLDAHWNISLKRQLKKCTSLSLGSDRSESHIE